MRPGMSENIFDDDQRGGAIIWLFISLLVLAAYLSGPLFYWLQDTLK